ncbi:MAG: hypothetical protein ACFBSE_21085 [Prochloraceae cyanobacterium]
MSKFFSVESCLQIEDLQQKYRQSLDPVARSHYQIIWLLAQGKKVKEEQK